MWVDYRGSLSTVYNDGEISTCGEIIETHSVQSTMMGRSQHIGRLKRSYNYSNISYYRLTCPVEAITLEDSGW